jgi:hypothetical protein
MLDGEFVAFVVTHTAIDVVRGLGHENMIGALVEQLYNQINTLRYGDQHLAAHMDLLARRAHHYLRALYDALLRPIEHLIDHKRLVVVPYRALHYVPFHALDNGTASMVELHELSYAPSASVLGHCLSRPDRPLRNALLIGVADDRCRRSTARSPRSSRCFQKQPCCLMHTQHGRPSLPMMPCLACLSAGLWAVLIGRRWVASLSQHLELTRLRFSKAIVILWRVSRWLELIVNYFIRCQTSGFVEGLNNKLKVLKRRCYGLRNITRFFQRLTLDLEGYHLFSPWHTTTSSGVHGNT